MDDFFRQNLASLRGSELKIIVALLDSGQVATTELMRLTGVSDRKTFFAALARLQELGVVGKPNRLGWETRLAWLGNQTERWGNQAVHTYSQLGNPTTVAGKPNQDGRETQPEQLGNHTEWVGKPNHDGLETPPESIEAAIALTDEMDAEGDERNPHSPFQIRRKQQIELIQQSWVELFHEELNSLAAKQLLQTARSQAADVYSAMVEAHERGVQYPRAYVNKILEGLARKTNQSTLHKNVHKPDGEVRDLFPVTQEQRDAWDKAERRLKASGLLDNLEL